MSITMRHICGIDICIGDYSDLDADFSAQQLADINTIATEKRRHERTMTYHLLNLAALGNPRYRHCAGATIGHHGNGAPYLLPLNQGTPVAISISHCRSGACVAMTDDNTLKFGIDIEDHSPKLVRVKDKFVTDCETASLVGTRYIASASGDGIVDADAMYRVPTAALLVAWTIKEAVYKAAGIEGLPLREGIKIISPAEAIAAGITYRCHTILTPARCITLAVSNE